nr:MAG TPA_asm: hypothetical protein [Caudoviricetes sp.]
MKFKLKYCFFLFRWWLIGRNFCNLPKWSKKWWVVYIANKALWILISFSILYTISNFLGLC